MNVFGVGGAELIAIFIIMLMFAGPKRMIHWSYVLGTHVSKFRKMWSQTVDLVQKEFDEAGVDITLPKEPPTRQNLNRALTDAVKPMTNPVQQSIDEVKKDMETFQDLSDSLKDKKPVVAAASASKAVDKAAPAKAVKPAAPDDAASAMKQNEPVPSASATAASPPDLGTWSGGVTSADGKPSANGNAVDLGTWSETAPDK